MLAALAVSLIAPGQIVIAGDADADDTRALLRAAQVPFSPSNVALLADGGTGQTLLATYQPAIAKMGKKNGRAAAYVCREYACREPISDAESLSEMLSHGRIPETRSS